MAGVLSSEHASTAAATQVRHGAVPQRTLVAQMLKLKWTLWKRSYRKNVGKLIGTIVGVLYGLGGLVSLAFMMLGTTLWSGEGETFPVIIRGLGALTVLLWLLIPVLAFGVDDTLDPRAFALYPRSARELQPGMFAAAALSIPSLFTVLAVAIATGFQVLWLVVFGQGALWVVLAMMALIPANLAAIALCLLLPRAVFAHSASRTSSRNRRELGGVALMVVMLAVIYGSSLAMQRFGDLDMEIVGRWMLTAVDVVAWTPIGALFAVPMDLAEAQVLVALARALIGAATLVLVWLWWRRSIDLALTSALSGDAASGEAKVSSLVPRMARPTAFGAVMGKSLRYWRRDTRYLAAVGVLPLVCIFFIAMGLMLPESRLPMLLATVAMCGFTGITLTNEIGFDGPAGWVNITAGLDARANQLGRIAAMALFFVPAVVLLTIVVPLIFGMAELIPLAVLTALGITITGWGTSLAVGVILPYPTSPPGTNPMKDKSSSSGNAMLAMTIASLGLVVPQLPALGVAAAGLFLDSSLLRLLGGGLSLVTGLLAMWVGLRIGTDRLNRRYPELFQKVRDHV